MGKTYIGTLMPKEAVENCFIKIGEKYKGTEQLITAMTQSYCAVQKESDYEKIYKIFNNLTVLAKDTEEGTILYDILEPGDLFTLAEPAFLSEMINGRVTTCFYDDNGFQSLSVDNGLETHDVNETLKKLVNDFKNQYDKEDNE